MIPAEMVRGDAELAKRLQVSVSTVQKWNMKGKLDDARYKIGKINGYDLEKVFKLLKY